MIRGALTKCKREVSLNLSRVDVLHRFELKLSLDSVGKQGNFNFVVKLDKLLKLLADFYRTALKINRYSSQL
jgi:hypothetical protein